MTRLHSLLSLQALRLAGGFAVALALTAPVHAQIDTLKVMIGANPGGGFDQTGRTLGAAMIAAPAPWPTLKSTSRH